MHRRGFFGALAAFVAGACGLAVARTPATPAKPKFKQAFRQDAKGEWREIVWEDMAAGDRVVVIDCSDGHLRSVEMWEVVTPPSGKDGMTMVSSARSFLFWQPEENASRRIV